MNNNEFPQVLVINLPKENSLSREIPFRELDYFLLHATRLEKVDFIHWFILRPQEFEQHVGAILARMELTSQLWLSIHRDCEPFMAHMMDYLTLLPLRNVGTYQGFQYHELQYRWQGRTDCIPDDRHRWPYLQVRSSFHR